MSRLTDLIKQYADGRVSARVVVDQIDPGDPGKPRPSQQYGDIYVPTREGTWDEVDDAYNDGLLSDDQYEELYRTRHPH
jgi:hypothetical protein